MKNIHIVEADRLEELDDDQILRLLEASDFNEVEYKMTGLNRAPLEVAYDAWVQTIHEDIRPSFAPAAELSDFDLYVTLRVNGVKFERKPVMAMAR